MKRLLIATVCSLLGAASAHAQTCTGAVSFATAPLQVGVEGAFSSNSHHFLPGVGYGTDSYFARGAAEFTSFSGADASAKGILGMGGAEFKLDAGSTPVSVCPLVTLAKIWGPSVENGFDQSSWLFSVGGSVGFVAMKTGQTAIVPTFGLSFNRLSTTSTGNFLGNSTSFSASNSFGDLTLGVGFLLNERMSLVPSIVVPFGLDGGETAFSVLFALKVGQ